MQKMNWHTFAQMYPHLPSRGIWWPRGILHKVILTFWRMQLRMHWIHSLFKISDEMYPPSRDIWWLRAVLHKDSFTCNLLIFCSALGEVSHTFKYRRYMSSWTLSNLCILLCIVVVTFSCCCYCVMLLLFISNYGCTIRDKKQQQQQY